MRSGDADNERLAIDRLPFRIGRAKDAELRIASREVSSFHAEIVRLDDGYGARDLDSRNGTFVNGERVVALASLPRVPEPAAIVFFNLHPSEMHEAELLRAQLDAITGALGPDQRGVLEIHESAVTDLGLMRSVRAELHARGLGLAYDDFGAGQSRLMELVEVPPEYLKLDMSLVRDIDLHPRRQELVRALIAVMIDLGIAVLAEGVERAAEGDTCRTLGCTLGQGYLYGRPAALP